MIQSPCTAYELRLYVESAAQSLAKMLPPGRADPKLVQLLEKFEKRVYGDKKPRWKFTPERGSILTMTIQAAHPDANTHDLLVFLIMCSFPDGIAKKIQINIDKLQFRLTKGLDNKIQGILKKAKEAGDHD